MVAIRNEQQVYLPIDQVIHGDALEVLKTFPSNSVHAIVCDPPAGINFMGKDFDKDRGGRDQWVAWLAEIMHEALRCLRPGGHALVWALPRTAHWTATALEDAGWEIRDRIHHLYAGDTELHTFLASLDDNQREAFLRLIDNQSSSTLLHVFGSGFPKSLDIGKAIDHMRQDDVRHICRFLAAHMGTYRITDIVKALGFAGNGDHGVSAWFREDHVGPRVPTWEQWLELKSLLNFSDEMDAEVWRLNGRKGKPGDAWYEREVIGQRRAHNFAGAPGSMMTGHAAIAGQTEIDITAPSTPEAQQWQGYGTALKPANEHWILARKPISEKSISANVLRWGTGAINIDQCRVASPDGVPQFITGGTLPRTTYEGGAANGGGSKRTGEISNLGRFPANLLLSHSLFCTPLGTRKVRSRSGGLKHFNGVGMFHADKTKADVPGYQDSEGMEEVQAWDCAEDCPIRLLDEQSGVRNSHGTAAKATFKGMFGNGKPVTGPIREADQGGASRYFQCFSPQDEVPVPFLYQSKASRAERNRGCEGLPKQFTATMNDGIGKREHNPDEPNAWNGNHHPTVKPLALCRWLIRLCTPPGGVVLDCFAGSGTIPMAAIYEHCHYIGVEQDASYVEIARKRVEYAQKEVGLHVALSSYGKADKDKSDCQDDLPLQQLQILGKGVCDELE